MHKEDLNTCPACGSIKKDTNQIDENTVCECRRQKKLAALYTRTNIPYEYWFKDLSDFNGKEEYKKELEDYVGNLDKYYKHSIGLFLWGKNGTGKTLLAIGALKEALKKKHSCFFASYSEIVKLFTSGWKSDVAKSNFEMNIENSDFLVIDDLGKEYKTNNNLTESVLDGVIRYRKGPTIITSNKNVEELKETYSSTFGESLASLIYGKTINLQIMGTDFRKDISSRLREIVKQTNYRSIK